MEYYTETLGLWQELVLSCEEEWECTGDSVRFKKKMENERVFKFLAGLNRELDDVRSRVLSRQPLPSIRKVFFEVRCEKSRRKVMLREHLTSRPEASTLVTHGPHAGSSPRQSKRTYCGHCKKMVTLKTFARLYMASLRIGSPDRQIKPIVIRPPPKPRQTKHPQKIISQLLVWGLISTNLRNYMSFFLISKSLVSLLPLFPLVLWPKKVPF